MVSLASAFTCFTFSFLNAITLPVSTESKRDLLILPFFPICSRGALAPCASVFHFLKYFGDFEGSII